MKQIFVNTCCSFVSNHEDCDELKMKKLKYGLEAIYNLISKTVILFGVALLLNIWKEYLLLILVYSIVRMYSYGIHAKTTLMCWITTTPIYIGGSLFIKYMSLPYYAIYGIAIFSFVSFLLWAPADTPAKPLIREEKRHLQKIKSCIICILLFVIQLKTTNQSIINVISYSLAIQSICINPITYYLTKTPYANYKIYLQTHGLN